MSDGQVTSSRLTGDRVADGAAAARIVPAQVTDIQQALDEHARYWGARDLRALHLLPLVHEFGRTCLVARSDDGVLGYLIGFVTPDGTGYVHLVATRDDARGAGLGRALYAAFAEAAGEQGAVRLKAITTVGNEGSLAFHRGLGFDVRVVEDYNGPGRPRVVFTRPLAGLTAGR
ncbi:GNAT family N-acetyltransferase [Streptomyces sp. H51]|uniref:GNAT family N-acetyltransferase n=1 Tax=Streptomyces sp. H51 TaxID=3111770 RepID=UPI002D7766C6|nr:GNAT family N-acetyltransferase [Streptomyces sp. H51]